MKHFLFFILLVAFGCQRTTVNGQQTLCTVPEPVEGTASGASTSSATACPTTVDCCPLSVDYYEKQIHIADSLYKNYLPQSNFEEVKKAMEIFDSLRQTTDNSQQTTDFVHWWTTDNGQQTTDIFHRSKTKSCTSDAYPRTVDCCPLTVDIDFIYAKAHYYHAVGLTERDDIVGACEHYLTALEIMEEDDLIKRHKDAKTQRRKVLKKQRNDEKTLCDSATLRLCDSDEDYEKIRFIALTYTRLGRLFLNENYCDLAIAKYRKALKYVKMIDDIPFKSNIHKELGNSYQLANKPDSALYYYGESLRYNSSLPNRLDVEKSIAKILFHKGEKDSAYVLLKNNLREIDNENLKYSYHCTLGDVYYSDKKYDSALYYLETSLDNDIVTKKVAFTSKLSAIYDSLGDYDKRDYYDNFSVKMFLNHANKEVDNKQLQVLYDNYKERKNEREKSIAKVRTRKLIIAISLGVFVILVSFTIFLKYRNKRHIDKLTEKIDDYANENKQLSEDFQKASSKKDKIIKQQKKEIKEIKNKLGKKNRVDLDAYYDSDICKKITARKGSDFSCLKEDELALLLKSADAHLNNISTRLYEQFPTLNTNDIYTICLIILNVEKNKFPYLLSRDRKTIYDRFSKIRKLMNIDTKQDLFIHIKDNYLR